MRPVLYVVFVALIVAYFGRQRRKAFTVLRLPEQFIVLLTSAYLVTVLAHAVTLLDGDRYSSLFDR